MVLQPLPLPVGRKEVSDEQVAAYQEMVGQLARRYNGYHGAEYDDLFQEGQLVVFLALRKGASPAKDIVARRMLRWVNKCARHGLTGHIEKEELDALFSEGSSEPD